MRPHSKNWLLLLVLLQTFIVNAQSKPIPISVSLPDSLEIALDSDKYKDFCMAPECRDRLEKAFIRVKNSFIAFSHDNRIQIQRRNLSESILKLRVKLHDEPQLIEFEGWEENLFLSIYLENRISGEVLWEYGTGTKSLDVNVEDLTKDLEDYTQFLDRYFYEVKLAYKPTFFIEATKTCAINELFEGIENEEIAKNITNIVNNNIIHDLANWETDKYNYFDNYQYKEKKPVDYVLKGKLSEANGKIVLELDWQFEKEIPDYAYEYISKSYEFNLENIQKGDYSEVMLKIGNFMNFLIHAQ